MKKKLLIFSFLMVSAVSADYKVVTDTDFGHTRLVAQIRENCTATFISPGIAITANHCVDDITDPTLPIYTGRTGKEKYKEMLHIEKTHKITGKDIAILEVYPRVNYPNQFFPKLASVNGSSMREHRRDLIMWGYPGSLGSKMVEIEAKTQTGNTSFIGSQFSYFAKREGGISGAGIRLKGREDTIIGVHTRGRDDREGYTTVPFNFGVGDTFSPKEVNDINEIILKNETKFIESEISSIMDLIIMESPWYCDPHDFEEHEEFDLDNTCDSEDIFLGDQTILEDVHIYETWDLWESLDQSESHEK